MWVSKRKWQALEKRIADLEGQVHGQLDVDIDIEAIRKVMKTIEGFTPAVNLTPDH